MAAYIARRLIWMVFLLFTITLIVNGIARWLVWRVSREGRA